MPPIPAEQCSPWPRSDKHPEPLSRPNSPRRALSIADIVSEGPFSRSFIYEAIKRGLLKARKGGRRTVILDDGYQRFLESLPPIREEGAK